MKITAERETMEAAGFKFNDGGMANDFYIKELVDGQVIIAGNADGDNVWGADFYRTPAEYENGHPYGTLARNVTCPTGLGNPVTTYGVSTNWQDAATFATPAELVAAINSAGFRK
jgi:hypothetical protein